MKALNILFKITMIILVISVVIGALLGAIQSFNIIFGRYPTLNYLWSKSNIVYDISGVSFIVFLAISVFYTEMIKYHYQIKHQKEQQN